MPGWVDAWDRAFLTEDMKSSREAPETSLTTMEPSLVEGAVVSAFAGSDGCVHA